MRLILTEIKVMDAYERYYSDVPSYLWEEIVGRLQHGRNGEWIDELLPETKWVLKLYKDKSPRLAEDLYKLRNNRGDGYIDIFNRAKERRMLRGVEGDLFKYKSIADLGAFIETLDIDTILGRTKGEQSSDINSAASNIEVPYEDKEWKVIIPKSYEASCYWGNGTKWCTATRETDEWYNEYSKQGPLYILIDKKTKDKYQFHIESQQFMDKDDREIDFPIADEIPNWNEGMSKFFIKIMENSGDDDCALHAEYNITGYQNGRKLIRTGLDELNYIKKEDGKLLLDKGFDKAWDFSKYGLAKVGIRNGYAFKYNFIDIDGNLISEQWFDAVEHFRCPYALVWKFASQETNFTEYCNFISSKGELIFPSWFEDIKNFDYNQNLIVAKRGEKWGCFKFDGSMWIKKWFSKVVYDPDVDDYVGYDNYHDSPTPIGVYKQNESVSYSMNDLVYLTENIMKNLNLIVEISSKDAYERFYKSIPEDEYYTIIQAVQGRDNDILLPETKWALGLRKKNSPRFMEDLQKLHNENGDGYLDVFLRAKERRMISGTQADLNQYKSIAELGRFVSSLDVDAILGQTKGEQSNAIHEAKDDIEKLYEDDEWIVLIPKTHEASCYWAKGAHWCTAYRDDDHWFNKYSSEGPLFMNIHKENPQYSTQFHIESEQYMDYYDNAIEEPIFEQICDGDILLDFYQNYLPGEKFMSMIGSELGNGLYAAYLHDYEYGEDGHDYEYAYFMVDINRYIIAGPFEDMYQFNGHDVTRVIYNDSKYNLVDTKGKLQFDVPLLNIQQVHNLKNKFVGKTCNASSMDDDGNITLKEKSHIVAYDNGQVIHFYQYSDFTCYGNFTLVKGEGNCNILNNDFQPVFKRDYLNIRTFALSGKQYLAIQKMNKWNISDISGNILWDNWVYDVYPNLSIDGLPIRTLTVNTGNGLNLYDINGNPMMSEGVKKFTWSNWKDDNVVCGVVMLSGDYNYLDNKFNIIDRDGTILHKGLYEPMNESRKTLNENYHGEIYHFTSLIQGSWIVDDDALYANISQSDECEGVSDNRKYIDSETPFISFTRDKNYSIQGNDRSLVCFVFDGDDIQKIRNARLYPFSYGGYGREESEEKVYGVNIKPLHKYLKRIEIKLSNKPYSWSSDRQFDEEDDLYDEFKTKFPDLSQKEIDQLISNYLVDKITNNKLVGGKVVIKNNVNESRHLLSEIKVVDAYTKYYQDIPERDFQRIILNIQKDNDTLLPETKWVLKLYKTKSPRLMEDLYKLCNDRGDGYLDVFKRAKERRVISGTQADLNQYKSIAELGRFITSLDVDDILGKTKGEQSNAINAAKDDIEIPYEDEFWKVVIPKSYEASCYWGNGTEWCTATRESDEWYEHYSSQGPLYININKQNGQKFQFHFETDSFMDQYDSEMEMPFINEMGENVDGLIQFYIKLKGKEFKEVFTGYDINGLRRVYVPDKRGFNLKKEDDGELLFDRCYDDIGDYDENGFYPVQNDFEWNLITIEGNYISDNWYGYISNFSDGVAVVGKRGLPFPNSWGMSYNLMNLKGEILLDEWYADIGYFNHGFARIYKNSKANVINTKGEIVLPKWYAEIVSIDNEGITVSDYVRDKYLYNKLDFNGNPIYEWVNSRYKVGEKLDTNFWENKTYTNEELKFIKETVKKLLK